MTTVKAPCDLDILADACSPKPLSIRPRPLLWNSSRTVNSGRRDSTSYIKHCEGSRSVRDTPSSGSVVKIATQKCYPTTKSIYTGLRHKVSGITGHQHVDGQANGRTAAARR